MYKNSNLTPEERAKDLLAKMTIDEKIDQMVFFNQLHFLANDVNEDIELPCRCGAFGNLSVLDDPDALDKIQDYFLNKTRLGIPLLMTFESLHGLYHEKGTVFPQCAGLGGSFDPSLVYEMARVIGKENRDRKSVV